MWTLCLWITVRSFLKDLHSSCSSPLYPNNLFVTFPFLLSCSAHVRQLHKVSFEFAEWYWQTEDCASWSFSQRGRVSGFTYRGRCRKMSVTLEHFFKAMDRERGRDYCALNIQSQALSSAMFSEDKIWEQGWFWEVMFCYCLWKGTVVFDYFSSFSRNSQWSFGVFYFDFSPRAVCLQYL